MALALTLGYTTYNKTTTNALLLANIEALTGDSESGGGTSENWDGWLNGRSMSTVKIVETVTISGTVVVAYNPGIHLGVSWTIKNIYCCKIATDRDRCNGANQDGNCHNVIN